MPATGLRAAGVLSARYERSGCHDPGGVDGAGQHYHRRGGEPDGPAPGRLSAGRGRRACAGDLHGEGHCEGALAGWPGSEPADRALDDPRPSVHLAGREPGGGAAADGRGSLPAPSRDGRGQAGRDAVDARRLAADGQRRHLSSDQISRRRKLQSVSPMTATNHMATQTRKAGGGPSVAANGTAAMAEPAARYVATIEAGSMAYTAARQRPSVGSSSLLTRPVMISPWLPIASPAPPRMPPSQAMKHHPSALHPTAMPPNRVDSTNASVSRIRPTP